MRKQCETGGSSQFTASGSQQCHFTSTTLRGVAIFPTEAVCDTNFISFTQHHNQLRRSREADDSASQLTVAERHRTARHNAYTPPTTMLPSCGCPLGRALPRPKLARIFPGSRLDPRIRGAISTDARRKQWPDEVSIVEVGPRDGLQNEPLTVPTEVKVSQRRTPTVSSPSTPNPNVPASIIYSSSSRFLWK